MGTTVRAILGYRTPEADRSRDNLTLHKLGFSQAEVRDFDAIYFSQCTA